MRASKERLISSIAKTIPASGVLKAAAMPAAEPARISPRSCCRPRHRATWSMNAAPTCTVGPSRPTEAPQNRPMTVRMIFPSTIFTDSKRCRSALCASCRAAIACGMPLPWEPGKNSRAIQAQSTNPAGVRTSGMPQKWWLPCKNTACAQFAALVNSTLTVPTNKAPPQKTRRRRHVRRDDHSARRFGLSSTTSTTCLLLPTPLKSGPDLGT